MRGLRTGGLRDVRSASNGLVRVLGYRDLTFFLIAALVNLNSVPVVAGAGPPAILFWVFGFLLFFLPQSVAVLELTWRYPQEGGIYNWTKTTFGDFHGFLSGWCYWTNNIFYVPTLIFYMIGFAVFVAGPGYSWVADDPVVMVAVSLALLWIITIINIFGMSVGKWVQNLGAMGTFVTTAILVGMGIAAWSMLGSAGTLSSVTVFAPLASWRSLSLLSIVCLNYVGLELGGVLGDEIIEPRRNMPRAVLVAGVSTVTLYLLSTIALQIALPAEEIGAIYGILQAVQRAAESLGMIWILTPVALLMTLNASGNTSAWLGGAARIPYVIGLDRYLPASLGRLHGRYHSPHVALIVQGIASSVFIIVSSIGSSVRDMYLILLQTTVVLQLVPYLYMFGAVIRVRRTPGAFPSAAGYFRRSWPVIGSAVVGLLVTAAALGLAFVPSGEENNDWSFVGKVALGSIGLTIPAVVSYSIRVRRSRKGARAQVPVGPGEGRS